MQILDVEVLEFIEHPEFVCFPRVEFSEHPGFVFISS
jgi:hypothetical protein